MLLVLLFCQCCMSVYATPPSSLSIPHGDLIFLFPKLSPASPLDNAILASGNATLSWLNDHNIPLTSDVLSLHVAISYIQSPTQRFYIQAVPPVVTLTPEEDFIHMIADTTQLFHGKLPFNATERENAIQIGLKQVGKPYANAFQQPPQQFYCSSLVEFVYRPATFIRDVFYELFVPRPFWIKYYAALNMTIPNTTGSNPTLLMHSPIVNLSRVPFPRRELKGGDS